MYENKCKFLHISYHKPDDTIPVTVSNNSGTKKLRRVVKNEGRASAFRRWLLRVFGHTYLNSGSAVVDVAGGKGELSFELLNLNGIMSTVYDPRPLDVTVFARKLRNGYYHRNEVLAIYNIKPECNTLLEKVVSVGDETSAGRDHEVPQHFAGYFVMPETATQVCKPCRPASNAVPTSIIDGETAFVTSSSNFSDEAKLQFHYTRDLASPAAFRRRQLLDQQGVENTPVAESAVPHPDDTKSSVDEAATMVSGVDDLSLNGQAATVLEIVSDDAETAAFQAFREGRRILRDCSVIVGMHPDQVNEFRPATTLSCLTELADCRRRSTS